MMKFLHVYVEQESLKFMNTMTFPQISLPLLKDLVTDYRLERFSQRKHFMTCLMQEVMGQHLAEIRSRWRQPELSCKRSSNRSFYKKSNEKAIIFNLN